MGLLHQRTVPQPRLHPPSPAVHTTPSAPMQCRRTPWLRWHTPPLPRPLRAADDDPTTADIHSMDTNQLQTALNVAIASEDYALAAQLRNVLSALLGEQPTPSDWRQSGILDWIAERAERLGFRYPTGMLISLLYLVCESTNIPHGSTNTPAHCFLLVKLLTFHVPLQHRPPTQPSKSARCLSSWMVQTA